MPVDFAIDVKGQIVIKLEPWNKSLSFSMLHMVSLQDIYLTPNLS
jgi:hypothetical protein